LHIRQKEDEPVEAALALARWGRCCLRRRLFCYRRSGLIVAAIASRPRRAITVDNVDRMGRAGDQNIILRFP